MSAEHFKNKFKVHRPPQKILATGLACTLWSAFLAWHKHQPSFAGWGIAKESYYAVQAFLGIVLIPFCFAVFEKTILHFELKTQKPVHKKNTSTLQNELATVYSLSIFIFYLLPDTLLYATGGFARLSYGVRFLMPALFFSCLLTTTYKLFLRGWKLLYALQASIFAVLAQGFFMALFWR